MNRLDTLDSDFELAVPQHFRFEPCLSYLSRSANECLYEVRDDQLIRLLKIGGTPTLVRICCSDDRMLRVQALSGQIESDEAQAEVSDYIRIWFDLDRDLDPFYRMAEEHPVLCDLTRRFAGLRVIGIPDLFEALCWAIAGQQVNLPFAYKLKERLTDAFGDSLEWNGRRYRLFPRPEQLAGADLQDLCGLQLTKMKAGAILEIARLMSCGELSRAGLLALGSHEAAEQELLRIRGVGPWTAHYVRMRCLLDPRAFPIGDVGLHNAVKECLGLDRKPTLPELKSLFADWAGWEAYATFYLWRSLY